MKNVIDCNLPTSLNAAPAMDTLIGVKPDHGMRRVDHFRFGREIRTRGCVDTQTISDFLQLASSIGFTDHTIMTATSQQQLKYSPASPQNLRGICSDDHVLSNRGMASRLKFRSALNFY